MYYLDSKFNVIFYITQVHSNKGDHQGKVLANAWLNVDDSSRKRKTLIFHPSTFKKLSLSVIRAVVLSARRDVRAVCRTVTVRHART